MGWKHEGFMGWVGKIAKGFSGTNNTGVPTASELWINIDPLHFALLCSSIFASLVVLALTIIHLRYVITFTSNENLRSNLYFIICTPLLTCFTSVVGMAMPRSAAFLHAITLSYYMVVLFLNVTLMMALFGSRRALRRYMIEHERMIKLSVPPYWKCCLCLPQFKPTTTALRICEALILQQVIIRIVLQIIEICVFYELGHREHVFFTVSHITGFVSMWIAFYMVYVLIDLGKERLQPYKYHVIFRLTDVAQTLASIQKMFVDVLVALEFIPGTEFFSGVSAGHFYFNCLWCWEMLILSAVVTYCFQPSKTLLFDKYHATPQNTSRESRELNSREQEELLDKYESEERGVVKVVSIESAISTKPLGPVESTSSTKPLLRVASVESTTSTKPLRAT